MLSFARQHSPCYLLHKICPQLISYARAAEPYLSVCKAY